MKQSIMPSLSFYLYIAIYFVAVPIDLQASFPFLTGQEQLEDQAMHDIYTTLRMIKDMHRDVEHQQDELPQEEQIAQQDFILDIMVVLVGTYEKIVGATVTYYLMMNMPTHDTVAIIIAEDIIKIINILGKRLIYFIFNRQMTWQEKVWYCAWVISVIAIIKISIDQIPQSVKPQQSAYDLPVQDVDLNKISDDKSAYIKDKFSNYK
jgi:hypothetical protein